MNKTYFRKSYQEVFKDVPITNEMHLQNSFDLVAIVDNNNNSVSMIPIQRATVGGLKGEIEDKTEVIPMNVKEIGERLLRVLQDRSIFLPTAETAPQIPLNASIPNTRPEAIDVGDKILNAFGEAGIVTQVDKHSNDGLGQVTVLMDSGQFLTFSFIANGLKVIK
jgi:hypothetical protein